MFQIVKPSKKPELYHFHFQDMKSKYRRWSILGLSFMRIRIITFIALKREKLRWIGLAWLGFVNRANTFKKNLGMLWWIAWDRKEDCYFTSKFHVAVELSSETQWGERLSEVSKVNTTSYIKIHFYGTSLFGKTPPSLRKNW